MSILDAIEDGRYQRSMLDRLDELERQKDQIEARLAKVMPPLPRKAVQPQEAYLKVMREVLPRDGFFVEEISQIGFTARMNFPVYAPRHYVTCGYQDNLGFGFNTALGVKVAHPDKAVLSVSGDGGFLFGVQELATAALHGINVVAVVFNNNAYGNVRRDQEERYGSRLLGADLKNPDFVALAESFGVMGRKATDPSALRSALQTAFAADAPVVTVLYLHSERSSFITGRHWSPMAVG